MNKLRLFKSLFLFFFMLYSVSPLSYSLAGNILKNNSITQSGKEIAMNVHVLLLDLLCSKISHAADNDKASSSGRIIIKKARSVVSETYKLRSLNPDRSSIDGGLFFASAPCSVESTVLGDDARGFSGHHPPPSCLSPPTL